MRRRIWLIMVLLALVLAGCDVESVADPTATRGSGSTSRNTATSSTIANTSDESYQVVRVVDGDTIIVSIDGTNQRLRYIGIDAPESVKPDTPVECFGQEASDENKRLVEGKRVFLERDTSDRDRFDRLLRYVYVEENGERVFVNEVLVANGYANSASFPPDIARQDQLRSAEREARDAGLGLWGRC